MTSHPLWMLLPWVVFAIAAGLKFWRLTAAFRTHRWGTAARSERFSQSERFRQSLERIWSESPDSSAN